MNSNVNKMITFVFLKYELLMVGKITEVFMSHPGS